MVRTDRKTFDNVISSHLEPALIEDASELLSLLPGVNVIMNVTWENGEIDLLAYHEKSNSALQVQAKAGVPPQGARMIAQVESRTLEAAEQLRRFLDLKEEQRDKICSSALGRAVSNVQWSSGVMVRTCLGTERSWQGIGDVATLNPVLLRATIKRLGDSREFSFLHFGAAVNETLSTLRSSAVVGWEKRRFSLFDNTIELPLLNLDYAAISLFRRDAVS